MTTTPLGHRDVLAIAVPIIFSNISTPLLGIVDTAVLGQLGDPYQIGAVAVGAVIFSMIFWGFGFLRMATSGFTAQADGANDHQEVAAVLYRSLIISIILGLLLIALQTLIATVAFLIIDSSKLVESNARSYFNIRIWSAPAALANYVILGWLIGLGRATSALMVQVLLNGVNAGLDALFVLSFDMEVEGVAVGTLIAEYVATIFGFYIASREIRKRKIRTLWSDLLEVTALRRVFIVNIDIMIRTLCLIFAFSFFTAESARTDDITLAANAILINFLHFSAHFLDGFAHAAQTLVGRAIGAADLRKFKTTIAISFFWAIVCAIFISLVFWLAGNFFIRIMTINPDVRMATSEYLIWIILAPIIGVAAYQFDGIFIGATRTKDMRNMMIVSLAIYLSSWAILAPLYGNNGLWASVMIFFAARAMALAMRMPALERASFAS